MENEINSALGITDLLIDAINKKYDGIRDLNSLKVNISEEDFEEMNPVIDSIIEDENNHIGKLQQLVDLLSGGTDEIEEGRAETIEIIDTGNSVVESITTMKKKLILSENFDNVIDDVQAVADPVFVGANEEHDENKKKYEDAIEENKKEAEDTVPKEGETGEKVKSKALKQMHLSEKLFESTDSSLRDKIEDYILSLLDSEITDNLAMRVASNLNEYDPSWCEAAVGDYPEIEKRLSIAEISFVRALTDMLLADKASLNEDLSFEDYDEFNHKLYNAIADVIFEFRDGGISESDFDKAAEWFKTKFFEEGMEDDVEIEETEEVEESLNEARTSDQNKELLKIISSDLGDEEKLKKIKSYISSIEESLNEARTSEQNKKILSILASDDSDEDKLKKIEKYLKSMSESLKESIQYSIAKEQIKRFTEGKMPKNWNVDSYLTKLTEKKHINKKEAKSLKEWYSTLEK